LKAAGAQSHPVALGSKIGHQQPLPPCATATRSQQKKQDKIFLISQFHKSLLLNSTFKSNRKQWAKIHFFSEPQAVQPKNNCPCHCIGITDRMLSISINPTTI
jgi:hypothetical protein